MTCLRTALTQISIKIARANISGSIKFYRDDKTRHFRSIFIDDKYFQKFADMTSWTWNEKLK